MSDEADVWRVDPRTGFWIFDTRHVRPRLSLDLWHDFAGKGLSPSRIIPSDLQNFAGRLIAVGDDDFSTFEVVVSPYTLVRNQAEMRRRQSDAVLVFTIEAGTAAVEQRGRTLLARQGDVLVVFMDVPFTISHPESTSVSAVRLPASNFPSAVRDRSPLLLDPHATATAALAAAYVRWQPEDAAAFANLRDIVREQLAALLCHDFRGVLHPEAQSATLGDAIRSIIEAEIANPDLSAKLLCARLGVSRTTLFEAVAAMGETLGSLVRERRLLACLRDMRTGRADTVAALSQRWGFREQSTFTRAFRRRFGQPPTQWRHIIHEDGESEGGDREHGAGGSA